LREHANALFACVEQSFVLPLKAEDNTCLVKFFSMPKRVIDIKIEYGTQYAD